MPSGSASSSTHHEPPTAAIAIQVRAISATLTPMETAYAAVRRSRSPAALISRSSGANPLPRVSGVVTVVVMQQALRPRPGDTLWLSPESNGGQPPGVLGG